MGVTTFRPAISRPSRHRGRDAPTQTAGRETPIWKRLLGMQVLADRSS